MSITAYKVPQKTDFKKAEEYKKYEERCQLAATVMSVIAAVYGLVNYKNSFIDIIIGIVALLVSILLFFFQWKYTKLYRKAETVRREGFLDNSFNTKMADLSSEGYYDTDEIGYGIKKMLSNLYENSLYTSRISDEMIKKSEKKLIIWLLALLVFALLNICGTQFIVALADIFITSDLYREYLELKALNEEIEKVKDECKSIADSYQSKYHSTDNKTMALILRAYVRYETAMAYASLMLDSDVFNDLNEQLEEEWNELKIRYNL